MIRLFKSKKVVQENVDERFILGDYNLIIDKSLSKVEIDGNKVIDLTIKTSENQFEALSKSESFELNWALYSPEFYARGIALNGNNQFIQNEENQFDNEVALYISEHFDVQANISVKENYILVIGFADIGFKKYPLEILIHR